MKERKEIKERRGKTGPKDHKDCEVKLDLQDHKDRQEK